MKLPEVREELFALAEQLPSPHAEKLRQLAEETRRRSPTFVARRVAPAIDDAKREEILEARELFPELGLRELGHLCDVNQGRVSEVLNGFRQ